MATEERIVGWQHRAQIKPNGLFGDTGYYGWALLPEQGGDFFGMWVRVNKRP